MQGSKMYQEVILDHYRNPRRWGRLSPTTVSHTGENASCGDELTFDLRLAEDGETIEEVTFTGEGCAISIASASLLAEELPGMTLSEVHDLDREDALDLLGVELTPMRAPCAVLAEKVVQDGIENYEEGT
ncbi:FeS assembly protein SufA [Halorubrum ezzemoulense]|uniref:FeS assembly protein SufA n=1 Tax=Halorubrum ezzemoulense TaxID=337243 RepID=A0A256IWT9_HALEZ|nr:iron-sulfur cluster assembly scaffold protein [Halorubrum ezzemoulense]OYR60746.1 FeS assembly protein SufA [Halorubrum ezzemoulense]OYR66166.1 FeS assembly protein SufA [Halorubrum ezzemoulense]